MSAIAEEFIHSLDDNDKKILDIIQTGFPLVSRPYEVIGSQIGLSEEDVFNRINRMKEIKLIRRLGANFQSAKLGFRSTLCAAVVPEDKLDDFIEIVNALSGVTHNYLRKHRFNVWFTLIAPSWEKVEQTLEGITEKTGIKILNLPATKLYKIKVDFKIAN